MAATPQPRNAKIRKNPEGGISQGEGENADGSPLMFPLKGPLTKRERFLVIRENPQLNLSQLAVLFGVSRACVSRDTATLRTAPPVPPEDEAARRLLKELLEQGAAYPQDAPFLVLNTGFSPAVLSSLIKKGPENLIAPDPGAPAPRDPEAPEVKPPSGGGGLNPEVKAGPGEVVILIQAPDHRLYRNEEEYLMDHPQSRGGVPKPYPYYFDGQDFYPLGSLIPLEKYRAPAKVRADQKARLLDKYDRFFQSYSAQEREVLKKALQEREDGVESGE